MRFYTDLFMVGLLYHLYNQVRGLRHQQGPGRGWHGLGRDGSKLGGNGLAWLDGMAEGVRWEDVRSGVMATLTGLLSWLAWWLCWHYRSAADTWLLAHSVIAAAICPKVQLKAAIAVGICAGHS